MRHTESPWIYSFNTVSGGDGAETVAVVYGFDTTEQTANGKLIAAAPELLSCLENLNQAIDNYWNSKTKPDSLVKLINKHQQISASAIAKATT